MDLRSEAKKAVKDAFKIASSLLVQIQIVKDSIAEYDPADPKQVGVSRNYLVNAVESKYRQYEVDGINIKTGDRRVYFDPDDYSGVTLSHYVLIDQDKYQIIDIEKIQDGVLVGLQLRKGG